LVIRGGATTTTSKATTTTATSATVEGLKSSLASALAAGCSKTLLAPFDTLKTIQQNYRSSGTSLSFWQAVKLVTSRPNGIRELYVSTVPDLHAHVSSAVCLVRHADIRTFEHSRHMTH
jgi:hypothetical protein